MDKHKQELERIIANEDIQTVYQPILALHNGEQMGCEALSRGPLDSPLANPELLLRTAAEANRTYELEMLLQKKAFAGFAGPERSYLFINVELEVLYRAQDHLTVLERLMRDRPITPDRIVFEITERNAVENVKHFHWMLKLYRERGYRFAIDDVGTGYSGLKMLAECHPDFIKVDMHLIRGIDKDKVKQALLSAMEQYGAQTGARLIAEGIETREELKTLINMQVFAGQGYFLSRPQRQVNAGALGEARRCIRFINRNLSHNGNGHSITDTVGKLMEKRGVVSEDTPCAEVRELYEKSEEDSLCVEDKDGCVVGMVMKERFMSRLATQYGYSVYGKRPISRLMDSDPLCMDFHTLVQRALEMAMAREQEKIYDDILVVQNGKYRGTVTIQQLVKASTEIERHKAVQLNPLTGLPGNRIINSNIQKLILTGTLACVMYVDLDRFKVYNDVYGFESGDALIRSTARILNQQAQSHFSETFIGHIGGDDFLVIAYDPEQEDGISDTLKKQIRGFCRDIIMEFDAQKSVFYNQTDWNRGYLVARDRDGLMRDHPLITLSIAGVAGSVDAYQTVEAFSRYLSELKEIRKQKEGSGSCIEGLDVQDAVMAAE